MGKTDKLDGRDPDGSHLCNGRLDDASKILIERHLVRAERLADQYHVGQASITERVIGVARLWKGYHERKLTHPEQVADLVERIEQYRLDMESLGLLDHQLDGDLRWIYLDGCF